MDQHASAESSTPPIIDRTLNKFSQGSVVVLSGIAFIFNQPVIVLITALALLISVLSPTRGPFRLLYHNVVVPTRLLKPHLAEDDPAPHRFAQAIGATLLIVASLVLFFTRASGIAWGLNLLVFALSGINLTVGFCAGCFVYYHLGRFGWLPRVRYSGSFRWRGV